MTGQVNEVLGVFLQRLVVVIGTLRLHTLSLTQFKDGLAHILLVGTCVLEHTAHSGVDHEESQKNWLT